MSLSSSDINDPARFKGLVQSLQLYKAAFGNLDIPYDFKVPGKAPWPVPAWGMYLGRITIDATSQQMKIIQALELQNGVNRKRQQIQTNKVMNQMQDDEEEDEEEEDDWDDDEEDFEDNEFEDEQDTNNEFEDDFDDDEDIDVDDDEEEEDEEAISEREKFEEIMRQSSKDEYLEEEEEEEEETETDEFPDIDFEDDDIDEEDEDDFDDEEDEEFDPKETVPTLFNGQAKQPVPARASFSQQQQVQNNANDDDDSNNTNQWKALKLPPEFDLDPSELSANDRRFRNVVVALAVYKQIYGDLYVPQPFVVPTSPPWPEDVWGLRLGARVNAIRSQGTFVTTSARRREILDELGFVWTPNREDLGRRPGRRPQSDVNEEVDDDRPSAASSLENIFGGPVDFGQDYMRPSDGENPPTLSWDLEGARVPEKMGKPSLQDSLETQNEYVEERTLDESLREAAERAIECGIIEEMGKNKRATKGKQEKEIPWFNDDFGDDFVFEDVVEALTTYKIIYGGFSNFTKDCDFIVPTRPERMGFLGDDDDDTMSNTFASGMTGSSYSDDDDDGSSSNSIAAEIRRLQKEVEQESQRKAQPVTTMNDDDAEKWPEHLAGMSLGHIVRRIRDGSLEVKHIPERKAQLDAIDFDWGDPKYFIDIPFEKTVCACYAYYLIRGDLFVEDTFIMPGEDPWPDALAGYELGKAVLRIRELQNSFEAYHPEKVSLLRMIDFLWFADSVALPLDPNEGEMTPEMIMLCGMGHPDYQMEVDIPMEFPDKIMEDGPFHDINDDPKLWWREYHNWDYVKDYWYQRGRRDNGYVLRKRGYTQMADEHEAKYGPGLFAHIDSVMADIRARPAETRSPEEQYDLLRTLMGFRHEMIGCTDIDKDDRDDLLVEFETIMYKIIQANPPDEVLEEELVTSGFYEKVEENRRQQERKLKAAARKATALAAEEKEALVTAEAIKDKRTTKSENNDDDELAVEEEEINLEDELGL